MLICLSLLKKIMIGCIINKKIEELKWFNINDLPANIVNDRVDAIKNYQNNIKYSEFGWNK
jgi:hypothetical protein